MAQRVFTQTFGVVGAIIERDGKILLVKEAKGYDKGKLNHPAGWIEVGENPLCAVKREVQEETGFDFTPTHILGIYSLVKKDMEKEFGALHHPIKIIFTGTISSQPQHALHDDISEAKWFTPEEICAMSPATLRDLDIKQMVKDYFAGRQYPLELLRHTVSVR